MTTIGSAINSKNNSLKFSEFPDGLIEVFQISNLRGNITGPTNRNNKILIAPANNLFINLIHVKNSFLIMCKYCYIIIKLNPRQNVRMMLVGSEEDVGLVGWGLDHFEQFYCFLDSTR